MVSSSVLRGVTTYLSSLNAKSAVYNDDLTLIWTNCDEFFKAFDTTVITKAQPIRSEKPVPVVVDKVKYVMNIVPLYRSKRLVCGYVCVLRDSYEVYQMVNNSAVSDHIEMFLQEAQEKTTRIIGISKVMEGLVPDNENKERLEQLIREQSMHAMRLFTEASSTSAITSAGAEANAPGVNCNVSALISGLCAEANQCLVKTKRKLIKDIDIRSYYAKIDYKLLALAFMSMFRSHLYISPLKSNIEVSSRFEEGDYFITVKSELLPEEEMDLHQEQKAMQDREMARKVIASDCDGSLTFTADKNTAVTEVKLPVVKKNRGPSLNNVNSEYLVGSYKPVHPFVDEITEMEEQAINAAKNAKTAHPRKIVQRRRKK